MLSCQDISERSSQYLDGELSPRQKLAFRFHLLLCRACGHYVDQLQTTRSALSIVVGPEIPADLLKKLQQARTSHPPDSAASGDLASGPSDG